MRKLRKPERNLDTRISELTNSDLRLLNGTYGLRENVRSTSLTNVHGNLSGNRFSDQSCATEESCPNYFEKAGS